MGDTNKVGVVKSPFSLRTRKSGAASINMGHVISILEQECNLDNRVHYFDYNNSQFFLYSRVIKELIYRKDNGLNDFLPSEQSKVIERMVVDRYFGSKKTLHETLKFHVDDLDRIIRILELAFEELIDDIKEKECDTLLIYVSPSISYQLLLIHMIKKQMPGITVIIMDDYTFEPATPYFSAIINKSDREGNSIGKLIDNDPIIEELDKRIFNMIDIIVEGEGYDFIREYFKSNKSRYEMDGYKYSLNGKIAEKQFPNQESRYEDICYIVKSKRIDLDELPFPNFSQMEELYDFAEIEFVRGCPYRCLFCERSNMMNSELSRHSIEYIVEMVKHIQQYDFEYYTIIDCCVNIYEDYTIDILKELKKNNINIKYQCNLRGKEPNDELLKLLESTGCLEIAFGIETIDEEVLESMNKEQNLEIIRKLTNAVEKNNMKLMIFLIIAFPTEKKKAARNTLDFIIDLNKETEIDVVEMEFYNPGHIQALNPNIYDKFGIEVLDDVNEESIKESSYFYTAVGFFGLVKYNMGMNRKEIKEMISEYYNRCKENKIPLATFYKEGE